VDESNNRLADSESLLGMLQRAFDALAEMPAALTLDLARRWFRREEWYLHLPAGDVLERHAAGNAMHITAPAEFVSRYAFECLWDCHWSTRELGCKVADLSVPGVVERLRELATDEHESESMRQAARMALGDALTG